MQIQPIVQKRIIAAAILLFVFVPALFLILNRPGKLHITTESDADIYVATSQDAELKKIGTGEATYSSRKVPSEVYVQIRKGTKRAVTGAIIEKRGKTDSTFLKFEQPAVATTVSKASVKNTFIEGTLVQGIASYESSVVSFSTDSYATTRAELSGLPYMQKILWYDKNNFIYKSLDGVVGQFINGEDGGNEELTDFSSGGDDGGADYLNIVDFAKAPNRPLALMSPRFIYTSTNMGSTRKQIAFHEKGDELERLFASNDYIFWFAGDAPSSDLAPEKSKTIKDIQTARIVQFDYTGKQLNDFKVAGSKVIAITSFNKIVYTLTDSALTIRNGADVKTIPLYLANPNDMIVYKDRVLVSSDTGVWQVNKERTGLGKVYSTPNGQGTIPNSLSINPDGRLLLSTRVSSEEGSSSGNIVSLLF